MAQTIKVNLSPENAKKVVDDAVTDSITGEELDNYVVGNNEGCCIVSVYEKFYYRSSDRVALTVCIDNFEGYTRVHCVGGGGGTGMFGFDWGAGENFEDIIIEALDEYCIG